jgi:Bromodomain/Snf2-ATP coupling, chromatin remodelling complex
VEEKILSRAQEKMSVSQLVVESGKFNNESVEGDNVQERKRLMEVLLTDFETSVQKSAPEKASSDQCDDEDDDDDSEGSEKEDLNELLSNNDADFDLYTAFDLEMSAKGQHPVELFCSPSDVPDWILNPVKTGSQSVFAAAGDGSRKRKDVTYDDGLTEKQFLKIMDKQSVAEESARKKQKTPKGAVKTSVEAVTETFEHTVMADGSLVLTDWTYRKLISCSKTVIALKDPATKRRLSDIFIEKPDPATFPDYYEIVDRPIAISDILRKCRNKLYASIPDFKDDWRLMFANAKKFNGEDSWVVQDASALEKELDRSLKKNGFVDDQKPPTCKEKKKLRIKLSLKKK